MSDDWDLLDGSKAEPAPILSTDAEKAGAEAVVNELDRLAIEYLEARFAHDAASDRLKNAAEDIARFFPEVPDEAVVTTEKHVITLKRSTRMEWDSEVLAAIYKDESELPTHVERKLTVLKRRYDALPEDEKDKLKSALTTKLSAPKIEVKPRV